MADDRELWGALRAARVGAWAWEIESNEVRWSAGVESLFGLGPGEFAGTYEAYLGLLDESARSAMVTAITQCLDGTREEYLLEHPLRLPDGSERWLECRGRVVFEGGKPKRMSGTVADVTEKRAAVAALEHEQALKAAVLSTAVMAVVMLDPEGRIVYANHRAEGILGLQQAELLDRRYDDPEWKSTGVNGEVWTDEQQPFVRVMKTGEPVYDIRHAIEWPDGRRKVLNVSGAPIRDSSGAIQNVVFAVEDVTREIEALAERARLEAQLFHAQKLDSLGQLAGGVAHDFNNLLTAIQSYAELGRRKLPGDCPIAAELTEISRTVQRAAELTGQLLAFARKQPATPRVMDVNRQVESAADLLRRTVGQSTEILLDLAPRALGVRLDPGQLEQTLVNLALNARDAMPRGGRVTISTRAVRLDQEQAERRGLQVGAHVLVSVSDEGAGMDPDTLRHAFEPFYTTKGAGRGTGLGLAICHGLVRQNGGDIQIASELGRGTRVDLLFPEDPSVAEVACDRPEPRPRLRGCETILLVEDEAAVRTVARESLVAEGYSVLAAADGPEALRLMQEHGAVDLLLTDVMLPGQDGVDLATTLLRSHPGLRLLFVSGHSFDRLERTDLGPVQFLPKPFGPDDLARAVRRALDERRDSAAGVLPAVV